MNDPPRIADLEADQPAEVDFMRAVIRGQREELSPLSGMQNALWAARTGRRPLRAGSRLLWPGLSALAIVLALGAVWVASSRNRDRNRNHNPDRALAREEAPSAPLGNETASTIAAAPPPAPAATMSVPPTTEPAPVPVESLPSANRRPLAARPAPPVDTSCSDEVDLIDDADAALRAGDAARALALTQQHAERCPAGTFIQERERIAVEALAKLGRLDAMRERARGFEERFPSSPHLRRVRGVVEHHRL